MASHDNKVYSTTATNMTCVTTTTTGASTTATTMTAAATATTGMTAYNTSSYRSDFPRPLPQQKQRIYDWDRFEFKTRRPECPSSRPPQWFHCTETLTSMPYPHRARFGYEPTSDDDGDGQPSEKATEYDRVRAAERIKAQSSRPRVLQCPQISLDELSADVRDAICEHMYTTTKTAAEITSGIPPSQPRVPVVRVNAPPKPFDCRPGKFQPLPGSYKTLSPPTNWRRVSIEWDKLQRRICGGRSTD